MNKGKKEMLTYRHNILILISLLLFACAAFNPRPLDEVPFTERAQTQVKGNIRVTAAVLSAAETKAVFDVDLYKKGIQPVWLEIENNDEKPVWFLHAGLDPAYFAPLEAAFMSHFAFSKKANHQMDLYFYEQSMQRYVEPGSVRSGFVFTHLDLGTKDINVDLIGEDNEVRTFTFFISVPGLRIDHQDVDWNTLYSKDEIITLNEEDLRKELEALPCCTTGRWGKVPDNPINLIIIGRGEDVHHALIRGGWSETASRSDIGIYVRSAFRELGRYLPVSPAYFYGRPQDAAFRKVVKTDRVRSHLRLWLSPLTLNGTPVWAGQINREIEKRSAQNGDLVNVNEPDIDEARTYILQNLWYTQGISKYGYVKGVGKSPITNQRRNLNNDLYFTDGLRIVLWISDDLTSFSEVEFVEWEIPPVRKKQ